MLNLYQVNWFKNTQLCGYCAQMVREKAEK